MPQLTIIANFTAKAGKVRFVKAELKKLVELSRAEDGCSCYDLHQDNQNPEHFLIYEIWDSREAWQAHVASAHLLEHLRVTKDAFEEAYVTEMTQIV